MPSNLEAAEFYRREADRLRSMAESGLFDDVRANLLKVARQYELMAVQAAGLRNHRYGSPLVSARGRELA